MVINTNRAGLRRGEALLAGAAAVIAGIVSILAWAAFSPQQAMWPLPALYLLEIPVVAAISSLALVGGWRARAEVIWAAAGSLLGFGLIGGFSIGFFYLPNCLLLAVAGLMLDRANWGRLPLHLGLMVVGAVAQVVVMFAAIGLLN